MEPSQDNCRNIFILASGSGASEAAAPPDSAPPKTIERLQYELLGGQPYRFNKDELDFCVHVMREGLSLREIAVNEAGLRAEFFAEPRPPLRACALATQYGWGLHIATPTA